jgi:hypothetical protein
MALAKAQGTMHEIQKERSAVSVVISGSHTTTAQM